jgi:hypothetical protein
MIRDGKGQKDRVTMLAERYFQPLQDPSGPGQGFA